MYALYLYLVESFNQDQLKHLEHPEDFVLSHGDNGFRHAARSLKAVHDTLLGKSKASVTTKYDGSPSIVFGRDPENGKPFVASKSAFNKNPKINYTHADIDRNHGHAPGLADKLKIALDHLHKVTPEHGVFQGDLMYTKSDVHRDGDHLRFQPNTITYSAHKDSDQGQKIKKAQIGLVPHTTYHGDKLSNMKASNKIDLSQFKHHPDVHVIDPGANNLRYGESERKRFETHFMKAYQHYSTIKKKLTKAVEGHGEHLKTYINQTVRSGVAPTTAGYVEHLNGKAQHEAGKVKRDATKTQKLMAFKSLTDHVQHHKDIFNAAFKVHKHLEMAKNALTGTLNRTSDWHHSIGTQRTGPEGFVSATDRGPIKLVHRAAFSRANFQRNRTITESNGRHHVIVWGRMNPPTTGHARLIQSGLRAATVYNASHEVIMSHSVGPKDPLTPEQKLGYATQMFPHATFRVSSKDQPSILHHAAHAFNNGIKHLVVVTGEDRKQEFETLLNRYNGKYSKHGHYNFDSIKVISAGKRDEGAGGVEGMSASKQREAAKHGNFDKFREGVPGSEFLAKSLYKDVRAGLEKHGG